MTSLNIGALRSEDRSHPVHPFYHPEPQVDRIGEIFHGGIAAVLPERV